MPSLDLTTPTLESRVQARLIKGLHAHDWYVQKTVGQSRSGYPDITAVTPSGKVWFIEVKQANGRLSPQQVKEINSLRAHQANVAILHGMAEVDAFIQQETEK